MVAEKDHDGVLKQPGLFQFSELLAHPGVHRGNVVVGAGNGVADVGRVGVEGRQRHILGGNHLRPSLGLRKGLALVGATVIEHRKEGLALRPVFPVSFATRLIPDGDWFLELVVLLGIVGAVVAGGAKVFGEAADKSRRQALVAGNVLVGCWILGDGCLARVAVPHLHGADAGAEHAGDQRRAGRGTDRRSGECVVVDDPLAGEPVEGGSRHGGVAIGADPRAHILDRKPEDIQPLGAGLGGNCRCG